MSTTYLSIKSLSRDDQPREKLLDKGRESLSNAELIAILIGSGSRNKSAVDLCREILGTTENDLSKLARLSVHDLMKFRGIGEAKAITIVAALELGRRRKSETVDDQVAIKSAKEVFQLMRHYFEDLDHEEFRILLLSRANKVKSCELISKGGFNGTVADGKLIFKKALEQSASAIILAHNHPSGTLKPSLSDIELTKKMKKFGELIDLPVLDHIIFTDNHFFSFADEGIL